MSSTVEFKGKYFYISISGAFENIYGEVQRLRQEVFGHPDFSPELYRSLWDLRGVEMSGGSSIEDLRESQAMDDIRPNKIAYGYTSKYVHGLVRQYLSFQELDKSVESVLLTADVDEADRFLRVE